jgi:hypothetical protein
MAAIGEIATKVAPNASVLGPHVLQSRQLRIALESPFASVETYCDLSLFEHHT